MNSELKIPVKILADVRLMTYESVLDIKNILYLPASIRHTSKPGPDLDSDLDSDPKKTRTREKPGLVLGLAFEKPGLDNRKSGLQIEILDSMKLDSDNIRNISRYIIV